MVVWSCKGDKMDNKQLVAEVLIKWAQMERAAKGDSFATLKEMEAIKSDPLGFIDLTKHVDARQMLLSVLDWN